MYVVDLITTVVVFICEVSICVTPLSADTLATLRSKVEAQKLALEATNSRLRSLRQPPVTSEPCIYPLPEGKLPSDCVALRRTTAVS